MKRVLFLLMIFSPFWVNGQGFIKYFPQWYRAVNIDKNGNFILAGPIYSPPNILAITPQGNVLTSINFPYSIGDIISISDSGYLLSCWDSYGLNYLAKTDFEGNIIWKKELTSFGDFIEDQDKNLIHISYLNNITTKFDHNGNVIWAKSYSFKIQSLALLKNGNYIVIGKNGPEMLFAGIMAHNGDTLFTKKAPFSDILNLVPSEDGNLFGATYSGTILKVNDHGDSLWSQKVSRYIYGLYTSNTSIFIENYDIKDNKKFISHYDTNLNFKGRIGLDNYDNIDYFLLLPDGGFIAVCSVRVDDKYTKVIRVDKDGKIYTNFIKGKISKDTNNNCSLDGNETSMSGMLVKTEPENLYAITDESGNYSIPVDTGILYKVIPIINSKIGNQSSSCYPFRTVLFNEKQKDSTGNDFFIKQELNPDLKLNYSISNRTRCFLGASAITIANYGFADAENVTVSVEAPSFYFIKDANFPFLKDDKFIQFNVGKIEAGKITTIKLTDSISCAAMLSDVANIRSIVNTTTHCINLKFCKDTVIIRFSVTGSFDPNDKQVMPSLINFEDYSDGNKELNYLIRFQNTGNGEARTVRVIDTLSSSLDIHSIRSIQTSHSSSTKIISSDPIIIEWIFENINLPYQSQSEELSQGFISFTIDLKEGLEDKTTVSNGAAIYFDYNEPVITNRATTLISSEEKTETYKESITTGTQKVSSNHSIILFPNPITESSVIRISPALNTFNTAVYDSKGIKLLEKNGFGDEISIHRNELKAGIYFYHIYTENQEIGKGSFLVK
jgi:hypothetical protein